MIVPFKVEASDVNRLTDIQLTQLLKELLHAEAYRFDIAQREVEVALNINVPDGGEDGRISWNGEPSKTDYLPNCLTMFQNKAANMTPSKYGEEVLTTSGDIKPQIDQVLNKGGSYIIFTTQLLNNSQKVNSRIQSVRQKFIDLGKTYSNGTDIKIYDASQIASWVNCFISTIASVQHWIGSPTERGLKTFNLWSKLPEIAGFPYEVVNSRFNIVDEIRNHIIASRSIIRIRGMSGIGKTRTVFRVFEEDQKIQNLVVYIDANIQSNLVSLVSDWISFSLSAILVVDNCEYVLHNQLAREVGRTDSKLSLITMDYNFDTVSGETKVFDLKRMADGEIKQLIDSTYSQRIPDLNRVVSFAQGFPKMAVLVAKSRLAEDARIGELSDDELSNKLLWGREEIERSDYSKILQVCSLFDVFGIDDDVEEQLEFIADKAGFSIDLVFECVQYFTNRGVIDRRGRFGQVVPKPLAIRLSGQWWANTREVKQLEMLDSIPQSMVEKFCLQIQKMDFHPNVKTLSESLCGSTGPFGQAEVILSNKGSSLFRSFVVVNPDDTCLSLLTVLSSMTEDDISEILGDVRRNLVRALEMLCFHERLFINAAKSLLLLASAENEPWVNNATGLFLQLFSLHLSGTEAPPSLRFQFIEETIENSNEHIETLLIDALEKTIHIGNTVRAVGSEYQGLKEPLQEWKPKIWQEVFDAWENAFDLLLKLHDRSE